MRYDYDVLVVGSGFGGSVTALRATEKGYRVGVIEAGRRYDTSSLPRSSWQLRRFLWAPGLGMRGIQRITRCQAIIAILSGAGVGGGSLNYANTLYEPLAPFYTDPQWGHITDWKDELAPFYDQAKRMLGVNEVPADTPPDRYMHELADRLDVADTYHRTPVGVWFGKAGERVPDPYFGGEGPDKIGCTHCGSCMVGCRVGAKNTLDRNYLYLAEKKRHRRPPRPQGDRPRAAARRGLEGDHRAARRLVAQADPDLHRRARRAVGRGARHREAAAAPARRGPAARPLGPSRRRGADQQRGDRRRQRQDGPARS